MNLKHILSGASILSLMVFSQCHKDAIADFSISKTNVDAGETITFSNKSSNAKAYSWDFGDGTTSSAQNPTHSYTTIGTYTVKLAAKGDGGTDNSSNVVIVKNPITVFEGVGIKEVNLYDSWAKVKTAFGSTGYTDKVVDTLEDLSILHQVIFSNKGVAFLILSADVTINDVDQLVWINVWGPNYAANTTKGVAIGDGISEANTAYGTPQITNKSSSILYEYTTKGIDVWYSSNAIVEMMIFEPYSSKKSGKIKDFLKYQSLLK